MNHQSNAAPVPAKGAQPSNSGRELGNTAHGQVLKKMPSRLAGQMPSTPKAVLVSDGKSLAPANARSSSRKVTPSVVAPKSKRKPVGLPLPSSVKPGSGNTAAVVPEGPTSLPATSRASILKVPLTPPILHSVGQKAPVVSRGWQVRPASIRSQVGEVATRWKVTPPGRIRHTMEIAVSNVGNTWRVDVKAHQQDGAWLTGALTNTTPLSQSFGQHGWELSQVSLSLGQPNSSGHGGQFFGQSGHSPPDQHYGGYRPGSARPESRWTGGPEVGIDYTA